jgi:choice-of-anchor B domain-containing protein
VCASIPVLANAGTTYDASGVDLLSHTPLNAFSGSNTAANDLWGYVSPTGREYAFIGLENGTGFVEVTFPTTPIVLDFIPHVSACCSDVKVYQEYAYIVNEENGSEEAEGMQVVDLSDIDNGNVTLVKTFADMSLTHAHNIAVNEESGFAYIVGAEGTPSNGGLYVVDLSDPVNPAYAGAWSSFRVHDVQVVSYTSGPYAGREIAFTYSQGARLRIVDVTNKSAMTLLGTATYPNGCFSHQGWLSEDRQYVYLNDECDETFVGVPTTTYVIDVSDLTNPTFFTSFTNGLPSTDHNLMVRGDFVFEANYTSGLRIYHVKDLAQVDEVGYFDTYPADDAPGFRGAWTVYTDLPSGNLLVSDVQSGLFVLDATEALCFAQPPFYKLGGRLELTIPSPVDEGEPIQWKKDGLDLTDDIRTSGSTTRTLVIDPLEIGDSGMYTATYDNGFGSVTFGIACPAIINVVKLPGTRPVGLALMAVAFVTVGAVCLRKSRPN